jgi:hypothetical protein
MHEFALFSWGKQSTVGGCVMCRSQKKEKKVSKNKVMRARGEKTRKKTSMGYLAGGKVCKLK